MQNHSEKVIDSMKNSVVKNYGIPGITSSLIGGSGSGMVRMFESDRDHQEEVAPHSHKFDFTCLVLSGEVRNRVWSSDENGDEFTVCELEYCGQMGRYNKTAIAFGRFSCRDDIYREGDWYGMRREEIHSIHFSRGCKVLFFEGPVISRTTIILEPRVDGEHIESFHIQPWMFKREQ